MIATKAHRIVEAAEGRAIMEFGARRSHNFDAAIYGARAAYIGGVVGTATTYAGKEFGMPALGTMAHSFVQSFETELDAFKAYCRTYPNNAVLLLDTYDTLKSGLPNAIKAAKEELEPKGYRLKGVRIDSGDMAYLSKKIRKALDNANMHDCTIVISNSLDEYLIASLLKQGAKIDSMGVGENLICSKTTPVFGGVYKLSSIYVNNRAIPKIKRSENVEKITTPHFKKVYRFYSNETGKAMADLVSLYNEEIDDTKPYTLFDPVYTWKQKEVDNFTAINILKPIFIKGKLVYKKPKAFDIREYCLAQIDTLWDEVKRFENPHKFYVDLTPQLWQIKNDLLNKYN